MGSEKEYRLPPIYDVQIFNHIPLGETAPEFLTKRGEWERLKEITGDGKGIKVGVGDTGVDEQHLRGDLKGVVEAKDFTGSRYGFHDRHSHGSHVTGHIGARSDGEGMVGLASSCELYHAKVLGDSGSGSTRGIADGIRWMSDKGCHIISLSLGGGFSAEIEGACREASEDGHIILAAMGNSGTSGDGHPGNSRYTFGIVAVDYNKKLANFSSRSRMAKYSGYGVDVFSCVTGGRYGKMSGTSMATPDQAGALALYLSWRLKYGLPLPTTMEELEGLYAGALEDLGEPGFDVGYGLGWVDIWKLIKDTPITPPPVDPVPPPGKDQLGLGLTMGPAGLLLYGLGGQACTLTVGDKKLEGTVSGT